MVGMLTHQDLEAIGNIIDEKLDKKLASLRSDVKSLKIDVNHLKKAVKELQKETKALRSDMNMIVRFFDNDITGVRRRVDRLEDYLRISS